MWRRLDPGLAAALAAGAILSLWQITWGLPAAEHSWAVDGLEPVTVLAIAKNSFSEWNSGWFYFKYPLAYPFTLALAYAPYLAYLFATGQWTKPQSRHPWGFADPDSALLALALIGRATSVLFTLGTIAVAFGIGRRLFGTFGGRLAAWLVATSYPVLFYAHTMNVDASYLFWILASLLAALAASESERPAPWVLLGLAAAMAVSTKEQAFGFLLPLPFLAVLLGARRQGGRLPGRGIAAMAAAAIGAALVVNNALFNPLGLVARLAYLLGAPITAVEAPLKPVAFSWFKGGLEWTYARQFWDGLDSALGTPLAWLAIAGAVAIWRRPRGALWLLLPALGYYYLSLRGQQLITMRYALPAILALLIVAAGFAAQLRAATAGTARVAVTAAIVLLAGVSLARAVELDLLLARDARYQAEAWIRDNLPAGSRGEVYQKQTYLPRPQPHTEVTQVPPGERSIAGLEERGPDFLVLSSASRKSISHLWNPDWRTTGDLLVLLPEADRMLRALHEGQLPYRRGALLAQRPRLIRPRITGLCPEIDVWVRQR